MSAIPRNLFHISQNLSAYDPETFFIWLKPRIFFMNFQSRQKTLSFEALPSERTIKMGLGRARLEMQPKRFNFVVCNVPTLSPSLTILVT